jgi:hypothetical protein
MFFELNISTQLMSRLITDNLHMRDYWCLEGHLLTPTLKKIRQTRAEQLLQLHAKNGHEHILSTDKKIFTIEEQYNHQNDKIYAQMSREVKEKVQGCREAITLPTSWFGGSVPSGGDTFSFL